MTEVARDFRGDEFDFDNVDDMLDCLDDLAQGTAVSGGFVKSLKKNDRKNQKLAVKKRVSSLQTEWKIHFCILCLLAIYWSRSESQKCFHKRTVGIRYKGDTQLSSSSLENSSTLVAGNPNSYFRTWFLIENLPMLKQFKCQSKNFLCSIPTVALLVIRFHFNMILYSYL